ncbi:ABC transporter permease [Gemella sp. zg-1178]|uniref:ABC transporter permease n=1 Tax=Gemella sp. zg-1178 TaxID=2840372 RepID=UPI001C0546BA|nr:ABC transporter permease [Gemella sp. zg-1178]MBU0279147.1 ABC transporter permease [Gemella sp. zg-1178]
MKVLNKDILREIWSTKSKFISIMIIMFLGVFVFTGLKETPPTMKNTVNKYFKEINMYDLKITNNFYLDSSDIEVIKNYKWVEAIETYYTKEVAMSKMEDKKVNIYSMPENIAKVKLVAGRLPENDTEIVLTEALKNKFKLNEEVSISYDNKKDEFISLELKNKVYKIVGFVYGADMPESSSNNSANVNFFAFVNKNNFEADKYAGVNVLLKNIDRKDFTREEYYTEVNKYRDELVEILKIEQTKHDKNFQEESKKTIAENRDKLVKAKNQLSLANDNLEAIKNFLPAEYEARKIELGKFENEIKEQEELFNLTSEKLAKTHYPRFSVNNIKGNKQYAQFINSTAGLTSLANIFSIFLFGVAILVSLTSLTRMIEENRTNIGTLKSLGYANFNIAKKYYIYGMLSAVGGGIFGVVAAYLVIVPIVYNSYARFLIFRIPLIRPDIKIIVLSIFIAVACVIIAVYLPLRKILQEKAAYLLRPKAPKNGSRIFLEHLTFIWKRLSFLRKVTFRNIFRYKLRMLMTIFGVLGCLALMFLGFGIRFGVQNISYEQFNVISKYDLIASYNSYITASQKEKLFASIENNTNIEASSKINISSATIEKNNEILDNVAIFTINNDLEDYFTIKNNSKKIKINDNGVVINEKLAYLHNLKVGDTFKIILNEKEYSLKVAAINTNYFGHTIFMTKNYYEKVFADTYTDNSFLIKANHNKEQVKNIINEIEKNNNVVYTQNNLSYKDLLNNVVEGIDIIVAVIVLCSTALAIVVLYNLININISERIRELSTIKVLGFYPAEVTSYVFREIFYLALIGIILGNFVGNILYRAIILDLTARDSMFEPTSSIWVYIISTSITLIIVLLLMLVMHSRLKKVNMIEALKSLE